MIQQRTVGHLRAAIRPNSAPQIYLPDRFRQDTTELADGTIVVLDEYNRPTRQRIAVPEAPDDQNHAAVHESDNGREDIEVKETPVESLGEQQQQRVLAIEELRQETENAEGQEHHQADQQPPVDVKSQPAPWETKADGDQTPDESTEHPDDGTKKPVSRAERRRLIKEEIMRLAQGDEPVYYQRRLY